MGISFYRTGRSKNRGFKFEFQIMTAATTFDRIDIFSNAIFARLAGNRGREQLGIFGVVGVVTGVTVVVVE
jgi:hypothetical protein